MSSTAEAKTGDYKQPVPYLTPVHEVPHTVRDVFGILKGWEPDKVYYTRNSSGIVKSVDLQSSTVTSETTLMGAERVGDFDNKAHMLTAEDRALLQGFGRKVRYPPGVPETTRRSMVAQCMPPPFANVLSSAVVSYQSTAAATLTLKARLATIANCSDASALRFMVDNMRGKKLTTCVDDNDVATAEAFVATSGTTPVAMGLYLGRLFPTLVYTVNGTIMTNPLVGFAATLICRIMLVYCYQSRGVYVWPRQTSTNRWLNFMLVDSNITTRVRSSL